MNKAMIDESMIFDNSPGTHNHIRFDETEQAFQLLGGSKTHYLDSADGLWYPMARVMMPYLWGDMYD